jgi:hypothetical protein
MPNKGSYGPALVATGPTTILTAPSTEQWICDVIWVSNPTNAAVSLTVSIGADAAATRIIGTNTAANIPANATTPFYGRWRIPASGTMTASAGTTNVLVIMVSYDRQVV